MTDFIWPSELPPFDEDADCPKCRASGVRVIFHSLHMKGFPCMQALATWVLGEHLCRVCPRCGYGWAEAPADMNASRKRDLRVASGIQKQPE
jgi:hypothetical protein